MCVLNLLVIALWALNVKKTWLCLSVHSRDMDIWDIDSLMFILSHRLCLEITAFNTVLLKVTDFCLFTGDVSPISMSPISQSQFIPLGEVLLLAISAMNSAHKPVTQEALTEHLQTCFPGNTRSHSNISQQPTLPVRFWLAAQSQVQEKAEIFLIHIAIKLNVIC